VPDGARRPGCPNNARTARVPAGGPSRLGSPRVVREQRRSKMERPQKIPVPRAHLTFNGRTSSHSLLAWRLFARASRRHCSMACRHAPLASALAASARLPCEGQAVLPRALGPPDAPCSAARGPPGKSSRFRRPVPKWERRARGCAPHARAGERHGISHRSGYGVPQSRLHGSPNRLLVGTSATSGAGISASRAMTTQGAGNSIRSRDWHGGVADARRAWDASIGIPGALEAGQLRSSVLEGRIR